MLKTLFALTCFIALIGIATPQVSMMLSSQVTSSTPWVTNVMTGTARNDFAGCAGVDFTPSSDITVTSLGRWVISGNSLTHTIYILDYTTPFTLSISGVVDTSGATPGQYVYVSVSPTVLTSGHKYSIISSETNGGDQFYNDTDTTITTTAATSDFSSVFISGSCAGAQTENTAMGHKSYVPPNFQYH